MTGACVLESILSLDSFVDVTGYVVSHFIHAHSFHLLFMDGEHYVHFFISIHKRLYCRRISWGCTEQLLLKCRRGYCQTLWLQQFGLPSIFRVMGLAYCLLIQLWVARPGIIVIGSVCKILPVMDGLTTDAFHLSLKFSRVL